jgi:shikimate dehydrogenase
MHIDGHTELVGIIGYPIEYTLSPAMHNAAFKEMGMNWLYVPLRVAPGNTEGALAGLRCLGFRGANVTIPHKMESASYVDELRGDAVTLKALNTIVLENERMVGYNTDVEGFATFLRDSGIEVKGLSVMLIGAGGASRAVALALARSDAAKIYVMNRTLHKAVELAALLKRANFSSEISERTFDYQGARVMRECEVIVNCTPLANVKEEELPLDYGDFHEGQRVIDIKYSRPKLAFLEGASRRGAWTASGEGMLLKQAAASFRLWTHQEPPIEAMEEALERAIADYRK